MQSDFRFFFRNRLARSISLDRRDKRAYIDIMTRDADRHFIRWRLNDPAEESRQRWTRGHFLDTAGATTTLCGLPVPDLPYMEDRDEQIPDGAYYCERCKVVSRARGHGRRTQP